jgi:MerR family transcriptional regulator, light-induced transcriptional regulator
MSNAILAKKNAMKELFTPKQIAKAIQVSESSIKRWCDQGLIAASYTAGGHRRVRVSSFLEFVKTNGYQITHPEELGLPVAIGQSKRALELSVQPFLDSLMRGDEMAARQIAVDLFLAENSVSRICDEVIARTFCEIGNLWQCGAAEIYQERRACEICQRVIYELRGLIPQAPIESPIAIGGTAEGDPYSLASMTVELVLRDHRWNANSLGYNLPFDTLHAAIKDHRPKLFWLSVSHLPDQERFVSGYRRLYEEFQGDTFFVLGGRAMNEELRRQIKYSVFCDTLQHLEGFIESLSGKGNIRREAKSEA